MTELLALIPTNLIHHEIALNTLKILQDEGIKDKNGNILQDSLKKSISNTKIYPPNYQYNITKTRLKHGEIILTRESIVQMAYRICALENKSKVAILNFASGLKPGGGFLKGSGAQEETICRASGFFPIIFYQDELFNYHHQVENYFSDALLFAPEVPFIFKSEIERADPFFICSIISSAAVCYKKLDQNNETKKKAKEIMKERIRKIIYLAIEQDIEILALGAFGCGNYLNDAQDITTNFKELLIAENLNDYFEQIIFPIFPHKNHDFIGYFSKTLEINISE
jgi:uncharacterized protein (TIGR02452 family)